MAKARQTNAPAVAIASHGGVREEVKLGTSGTLADVSGLYAEDLPAAGGLQTGMEARLGRNRLTALVDSNRNWQTEITRNFYALISGKITNKPNESRIVNLAGNGGTVYTIPRTAPEFGGNASNAVATGLTRYSTDNGATWRTDGMVFNPTLQQVGLGVAIANGSNVKLDLGVQVYQGVGVANEFVEVLAASPVLYVSTAGTGAAVGNDYGGYPDSLVLARLPSNDYGNYFSTGQVQHDAWYGRQDIPFPDPTAAPNQPNGVLGGRTLAATPIIAAQGPAAAIVGRRVQLFGGNTRTRGLGIPDASGYGAYWVSGQGLGTLTRNVKTTVSGTDIYADRTVPASIPRMIAWPLMVRRESTGQILLLVVTDAQRPASTVMLANGNTVACDLFPLLEDIYV